MHNIEFGLVCISEIIDKEFQDVELAEIVKSLASASHIYTPDGAEPAFGDAIEKLRKRAKL